MKEYFRLSEIQKDIEFGEMRLGYFVQDYVKRIEDSTDLNIYLEDIFTVHANLAGTLAISIPRFTNIEGSPFGIQAPGPKFKEEELFSFVKMLDELKVD